MSTRFLLDTSALLAHNRGELGCDRVQEIFEETGARVLVASVTLAEFARRLRDLGATVEDALQEVENYLLVIDEVVPVDEQVARDAFRLGCETPERLPLVDALIAATSRTREARLVHRDHHLTAIPPHLLQQLDLAAEPASP